MTENARHIWTSNFITRNDLLYISIACICIDSNVLYPSRLNVLQCNQLWVDRIWHWTIEAQTQMICIICIPLNHQMIGWGFSWNFNYCSYPDLRREIFQKSTKMVSSTIMLGNDGTSRKIAFAKFVFGEFMHSQLWSLKIQLVIHPTDIISWLWTQISLLTICFKVANLWIWSKKTHPSLQRCYDASNVVFLQPNFVNFNKIAIQNIFKNHHGKSNPRNK